METDPEIFGDEGEGEESRMSIGDDQLFQVCKYRQADLCCSFLTMAPDGFECGKGTPSEAIIRSRREAGTMKAKGDNCSGPPDFEATAVDAKEAPA